MEPRDYIEHYETEASMGQDKQEDQHPIMTLTITLALGFTAGFVVALMSVLGTRI